MVWRLWRRMELMIGVGMCGKVVYWLIVEVDGVEWDEVDGEIIMV